MSGHAASEQQSLTRRRLEALAGADEPLLSLLRRVGAEQRWWEEGADWVRRFALFDADRSPFCMVLYETAAGPQQLCLVQCFARGEPGEPGEKVGRIELVDPLLGVVRLTRFPHDPGLPTLPAVLAQSTRATVLRYRPRKRCTLRVIDRGAERPCFVKVFADQRCEKIHQDSLDLWEASCRGGLDFAVARPLRCDADLRALWQGVVTGAPILDQLFCAHGHGMAERMGRACASITGAGLRPIRQDGPQNQARRTARRGRELSRRLPALASDIDDFLSRLSALLAGIDPQPLYAIHGAPHAHQWLDSGERLGLVDFDGLCIGHRELDVATFLAEMDYEDPGKMPVDELNQAFVDGYQAVAGRLNPELLRAYRAQKHFSKAFKASGQLRVDRERRAQRKLARALRWLEPA